MYWCKPLILAVSCLLFFYGCKPDVKETKAQYSYFDLKGFMSKDSARLVAANPWVEKTVSHNNSSETKKVKIINWAHELSLFTSSDINKPSWSRSYTISSAGDSTIYTSKEPGLKTQRLVIAKKAGKVKSLHIINHIKNLLFEAGEDLFYFPDSVYIIDKKQHVLFLGDNHYLIKGKLKK